MIYVDWLEVASEFWDLQPIVASVVSDHTEVETGTCFRTCRGQPHRGSWDSQLLVRSDGHRVTISGNPSRFNRAENLGGCPDLLTALTIYDDVLERLHLPPVAANATIQRIDLVANLEVGRGQERAVLRWLSGQVLRGKVGHLYPDGYTVAYLGKSRGSSKVHVKYYAKGPEMRLHKAAEGSEEWRARCASWCDERGVIRHEVTLRSAWLKRRGLGLVREWLQRGNAAEVVKMYAIHERPGAAGDPCGDLVELLLEQGHGERAAHRFEMVARAWVAGLDCRQAFTRSVYYRTRKALLAVGFDIAVPYEVKRVSVVPVVVEVRPAELPDWYVQGSPIAA